MRVLVGCEFSGRVRDAFRALGHDAVSCDLLPSERPGPHIRGDIRSAIRSASWDLLIVFPDCKYLARSGLHWNARPEGIEIDRARRTEEALQFVRELLDAPVPRIALENPVGAIGTRIRPADQIIHPWQFGHHEPKT